MLHIVMSLLLGLVLLRTYEDSPIIAILCLGVITFIIFWKTEDWAEKIKRNKVYYEKDEKFQRLCIVANWCKCYVLTYLAIQMVAFFYGYHYLPFYTISLLGLAGISYNYTKETWLHLCLLRRNTVVNERNDFGCEY